MRGCAVTVAPCSCEFILRDELDETLGWISCLFAVASDAPMLFLAPLHLGLVVALRVVVRGSAEVLLYFRWHFFLFLAPR